MNENTYANHDKLNLWMLNSHLH